jgi:hypothetical protein
MAATSTRGGGAVRVAVRVPARALTPAEAAWVAAVPCALLLLAVILVLGPPLGRLVFPPPHNDFWPSMSQIIWPEPTEHAAYLIALGGPLLLSAAVLALVGRSLALGAATRRTAIVGAQLAACAFVAVCVVAQHVIWFGPIYTLTTPQHRAYFTWPTIAVALVLALAATLALRDERWRARGRALLRETRGRRLAAWAVAAIFTAVWLLTAINFDSSVGHVNRATYDMLPWSMDETFAILDGRAPLLTFHAQYGQLWPYVAAGALTIVGTSLAAYTIVMATITGAGLLAIFSVLRRVTRSSLAALALFAPLVANGFFLERGPLANRYGPSNLFTIFPTRYAGPYLLAWLVMRHLDGRAPRRRWLVFLAAGLVAINNVEFGAPALAAAVAACIWAALPRTRAAVLALGRDVAAGVLAAMALVALLTLVRTGSLPDFAIALQFAKLYAVSGWAMLPMPHLGVHLVLYATFCATIVAATVRAASGERDRVLTGLLVWSGVFGLGAAAYYSGRSHPEVLIDLFSAWTLSLALLVVLAVRALAARPRWPAPAELAVLAVFGLAVCSLAQTPTPWSQIQRLGDTTPIPAIHDNPTEHFIARETHRGERVVILNPYGHRLAYELGLVNVSPYSSGESITTQHQLVETVNALRAAHGRRLFLWEFDVQPEIPGAVQALGFRLVRRDQASGTFELVDEG